MANNNDVDGVLIAPGEICPDCGAIGKVEMVNYEILWREGDIHCSECGAYIRKYDAG